MREKTPLVICIIAAFGGVLVFFTGWFWSRQPTCDGCGANIGAGMLAIFGLELLGLSVIAIVVTTIWTAIRRARSRRQPHHPVD